MHRAGFVNILGRPNVGKSTLLNQLVGERLAIITSKPQTTRHRILGVVNEEDFQIVYSDTPGIIEDPAYKLQSRLNNFAFSTFEDADILLLLTDPFDPMDASEELINRLNKLEAKKVLVCNKVDLDKGDKMQSVIEYWKNHIEFSKILHISALEGQGVEALRKYIVEMLPISPPYFPKDQLTDRPERFFVTEIIREEILLQYKQEIPFSTEVEIEAYQEEENLTRIAAIIHVNRKTQKPIIIGKGGQAIKKLGTAARHKIETFLAQKVYLELHVRISKDWRNSDGKLRMFGYG